MERPRYYAAKSLTEFSIDCPPEKSEAILVPSCLQGSGFDRMKDYLRSHDRPPQHFVVIGLAVIFLTALTATVGRAQQGEQLDHNVPESFPNLPIEQLPTFRQYSAEIFLIVADKMGIWLDQDIPRPVIVTDLELTLAEFNLWLGQTEILFHSMSPYYFSKQNIILIPGTSTLDTLAHELVHYFQVRYQKTDVETSDLNQLELEAILLQRWFRAQHMRPVSPGNRVE